MKQKQHRKTRSCFVLFTALLIVLPINGCSIKSEMQRQTAKELNQKYGKKFNVGNFQKCGLLPWDSKSYVATAYEVTQPNIKFRVKRKENEDFLADGYQAALAAEEMSKIMKEALSPFAEEIYVQSVPINEYGGGYELTCDGAVDALDYYFEGNYGAISSSALLVIEDINPKELYQALESHLSKVPHCNASFALYCVPQKDFSKARTWLEKQGSIPETEELRVVVSSLRVMSCGFENGAMTAPFEKFADK